MSTVCSDFKFLPVSISLSNPQYTMSIITFSVLTHLSGSLLYIGPFSPLMVFVSPDLTVPRERRTTIIHLSEFYIKDFQIIDVLTRNFLFPYFSLVSVLPFVFDCITVRSPEKLGRILNPVHRDCDRIPVLYAIVVVDTTFLTFTWRTYFEFRNYRDRGTFLSIFFETGNQLPQLFLRTVVMASGIQIAPL